MSRAVGTQALREQLVPLALLLVLSTAAGLGFGAVFLSWSFAWIPLLGALTGTAVGAVAIHRRLLLGESMALSILAFVVVGAIAVGGATPSGALAFLRGVVTGWAELLTSFTPLTPTRSIAALPFVVSWAGAAVGVELLRGTRVPALPAVGPLLACSLALLFTVEDRVVALSQGVVIVAGTLALGLVQQQRYRTLEDDLTTGSTQRWSPRGLVTTAAVLALAVVGAPLLGPHRPFADAHERFDLRDHLVPPFDPLALPSPLTGLKGQLRDGADEDTVLVIRSADRPARWTTAVLGSYDGMVWTVAESAAEDAGRYRPVDERFPAPPAGDLSLDRQTVQAEVTVIDLDDHWLPRPGWVTTVDLGPEEDVRFNDVTGNVALPGKLREGLRYRVSAVPLPTEGEVAGARVAGGAPDIAALPPVVRNLVADLVQGEDGGWPQVRAIQQHLTSAGYYDLSDSARPGHSLFRLGEFLADADRIVGYEEQYAAAAAVAVRSLGQPARVVVGYRIPEDRWEGEVAEVLTGDASAWIEVRTELGWVALDVTPDQAREPEEEERGRTVEDVAVPNPPPPPPPPPDTEPPELDELDDPEVDEDEEEAEETLLAGLSPVVLYTAAGVGTPLLLLAALAGLVAALRARRRNRRRAAADPAVRVAGAWQELLDRCAEVGLRRQRMDSTQETAQRLAEATGTDPSLWRQVADQVDRAAYHPAPPSDDDASALWVSVIDADAQLRSRRDRRARLRARLDPRPVLRRDPVFERAGATARDRAPRPDPVPES